MYVMSIALPVILYLVYYVYYFITHTSAVSVGLLIGIGLMWAAIGIYIYIHLSTKVHPETGCNNEEIGTGKGSTEI